MENTNEMTKEELIEEIIKISDATGSDWVYIGGEKYYFEDLEDSLDNYPIEDLRETVIKAKK